jgi:hypothetical protein
MDRTTVVRRVGRASVRVPAGDRDVEIRNVSLRMANDR